MLNLTVFSSLLTALLSGCLCKTVKHKNKGDTVYVPYNPPLDVSGAYGKLLDIEDVEELRNSILDLSGQVDDIMVSLEPYISTSKSLQQFVVPKNLLNNFNYLN